MELQDIDVEWNKTICIAGARNQGKANLAQALVLMKLAPQCDVILLFGNSGSLTQWSFLEGPGMPHRVYAEVKDEVIEECFRINGARLQKNKPPIRTLLIFDDSLSRTTIHSDAINKLFIHGRIHHLCPMIIQQSVSQIHPDWRRNADYWFVFKPRTLADKVWIYENLLVETETKNEAFQLIHSIPKHTALVVDFCGGETTWGLWKAPLLRFKD